MTSVKVMKTVKLINEQLNEFKGLPRQEEIK